MQTETFGIINSLASATVEVKYLVAIDLLTC